METWAIALPILPGKTDLIARAMPTRLRAHAAEYERSRQRAGGTFEQIFVMHAPTGDVAVYYEEADRGFGEALGALVASDAPIDRWVLDTLKEAHGVDLRQPPAGPPPEILYGWDAPGAPRGRGLAFAAPIRPGKTDALRRFFAEALGPRREEFARSRMALGLTAERAYLLRSPQGDLLCVYLAGADPVAANAGFARSTAPYDVWFKEQCAEIFPVDFSQPLPPIEQIWAWDRIGVMP
jgi:hypothetical protein